MCFAGGLPEDGRPGTCPIDSKRAEGLSSVDRSSSCMHKPHQVELQTGACQTPPGAAPHRGSESRQ